MKPAILFFKAHVKQYTRKDGVVVKEHEDKRQAKQQMQPTAKRAAPGAVKEDSGRNYGTHNVEHGDHLSFDAGGKQKHGVVVATGDDGATVVGKSGKQYKVLWAEVRGFKGVKGTKKPDTNGFAKGERDYVPPDKFNANEWKQGHDDPNVTVESVLANFPPDTQAKMDKAARHLKAVIATDVAFKGDNGEYAAKREALHDRIFKGGIDKVDPETGEKTHIPGLFDNAARFKPANGEKPTLVVLGGRGGSGKSQLAGLVYDPNKALVLDADHIKEMLPEYEGWNAAQVHEESSDLMKKALARAQALGLNTVLDVTMQNEASTFKKIKPFKDAGYRVEAHYMHLPRQESAKRAVSRFLGKTKRLVPVDVILGNTTNEATFDAVKKIADAWSFRDNNVRMGEKPILISKKGTPTLAENTKQ